MEEKIIPDPPGTVRHGQVYKSMRTILCVGKIVYTTEDIFEVDLVDPVARKIYRYRLSYLEKAIEAGVMELQELEIQIMK